MFELLDGTKGSTGISTSLPDLFNQISTMQFHHMDSCLSHDVQGSGAVMDSSPHPLQIMVTDDPSSEVLSPNESQDSDVERPEAPRHIQITEQNSGRISSIELNGIRHPALLVNGNLEIAWQNKGAIEKIWQRMGAANNGNPTPIILDLIFDTAFNREVVNFPQCLEFFLIQFLGFISADDLRDRTSGMPTARLNTLSPLIDQITDRDADSTLYGGYFTLKLRDGRQTAFKVVALNCDEGRLLIFDPNPDDPCNHRPMTDRNAAQRFEHIRIQPNPVLTSHFILAAKINQASILRSEMLAEDHWRLINALYQGCLHRIERYGGIFGQYVGDGFIAYFLPDQNLESDAMGVIECALEIKAEAAELGRKWRISRNWVPNVDINIGIHYEEAFVGSLPVSSGDILTNFGEGVRVANTISRLAEEGQIWATKPVIHRIPPARSRSMRFGILKANREHRKRFLRNAFGSVGSVFDLPSSGGAFEDELRFLPVTQIFDLSGIDR